MLDYYGLQQMQLNDSLNELERAAYQRKQANEQMKLSKKIREDQKRKIAIKKASEAVKTAEREMRQAAEEAVKIGPHLAYLWFKARNSKLNESIRDAWQEILTINPIPPEFHFLPDTSAVSCMPYLSFMLCIPFRLQKPYLSMDERDFHLLDNPLRREKVFQTPMVAATSWKGALRAALWQLGYKQDNPVTVRLLGNKRKSEEQQAGRLYCHQSLGVLQENGVYACFLYLLAKEKENGKVVVDEMLNLLEGLGFGWGKPNGNCVDQILQYITDKVSGDSEQGGLERLLLAKETVEQMLIYLTGAERTEREGLILQGGDESGVLPVPIDNYIR